MQYAARLPLRLPPHATPAGAISEAEVKEQIWALLLGGIGVAFLLDRWAGKWGGRMLLPNPAWPAWLARRHLGVGRTGASAPL